MQTYTDQDAKIAAISYSSATTNESADASLSTDAAAIDGVGNAGDKSAQKADKFKVNRVENVSGSSAGAGSGDFHMYRAARRR